MNELHPGNFGAFFKSIHGVEPFPWQQRLLEQVAEKGVWPPILDLPTGSGKTAALDVALFHLAMDARNPSRTAPCRILFVVDRRTVVDQTALRARKVRDALRDSTNEVVRAVCERLCSLSDEQIPLQVAELRGGIARDDAWARSPAQPVVAISTVDQVGSRLLFRGYGVTDSMRPIHAGLLGNDALLLLDEVHLSHPFAETLRALKSYRSWPTHPLPDRFQVVEMSATPGVEGGERFSVDKQDRKDPELRLRFMAKKPFEVQRVEVGAEAKAQGTWVRKLVEAATKLSREAPRLGVIVNRVATAMQVHDALLQQLGDTADIVLMVGRMRPLDRDDVQGRLMGLAGASPSREAPSRPVIVVATQSIEAGADLDFDALLTECASLDALRQRFGRLNRLGRAVTPRAMVLMRSDSFKDDDPIYGAAMQRTFSYLENLEVKDFGLDAFVVPEASTLEAMLAPSQHAPVMLPAHLDAWVQTTPIPYPDPDISLWLHGPDRGQPEVSIVWRVDLPAARLEGEKEPEEKLIAALIEQVDGCPPLSLEAMSVPLSQARAWLRGEPSPGLGGGDVEGGLEEGEESSGEAPPRARRAIAWRGDASKVVSAADIRPGDTLVVPSAFGGVRHGCWDASSPDLVKDLGTKAWLKKRKPVLRAHPFVLQQLTGDGGSPVTAPLLPPEDDEDANLQQIQREWLRETHAVGPLGEVITGLLATPHTTELRTVAGTDDRYLLLSATRVMAKGDEEAWSPSTEDESASFTGVTVSLRDHLQGVADFARRFTEQARLPSEIAQDIVLAASWHDAGKADPRFQQMLHGGSAYKASVAKEPIAKSAKGSTRAMREAARKLAGYPRGGRHEAMSVRLLETARDVLQGAKDPDLVLHLIASHHGSARPFLPVSLDETPVDVRFDVVGPGVTASSAHGLERLDSGVSERFWNLVRRYGWHGLAWMEAIVRLADHRRSEAEQRDSKVGIKETT